MSNFYSFCDSQSESNKACLISLKQIILAENQDITSEWKYGMPFFYFKRKMLCYLWVHKKYKQPYIGIADGKLIEHPSLLIEKRSRMKIMLIDPEVDLPIETIKEVLNMAIGLHSKI